MFNADEKKSLAEIFPDVDHQKKLTLTEHISRFHSFFNERITNKGSLVNDNFRRMSEGLNHENCHIQVGKRYFYKDPSLRPYLISEYRTELEKHIKELD